MSQSVEVAESVFSKLAFVDLLLQEFNNTYSLNKGNFAKSIVASKSQRHRVEWALRVQSFLIKLTSKGLILPLPRNSDLIVRTDLVEVDWGMAAKIALLTTDELDDVLRVYKNAIG